MRNRYLENFDNIVMIEIKGKNINAYINRLMKQKIEIIKLTPISNNKIHLILKYTEYLKIKKIKSIIYKTTIISYMGNLKIKKKIKKNSILILLIILCIFLLILLSRIIFSIEVIHQDKEIRNLVTEELEKYNIKKYELKKSYKELERIEDKILQKNKDKLEWIEINEIGTKYIIRIEERKINQNKEQKEYQNIISTKEAIITNVKAKSGEKIKTTNDYVKKGDIIIAGYITLPNNTQIPTRAEGEVLGEVWYTVKIDYPFIYQESKLTGKSKTIYTINFKNKKLSIFDFKKYHTFSSKNKVLISSLLLNIQLVKEKQYETKVLDEVYTADIAKNKAIDYITRKMKKNNPNIKKIKETKILTSSCDEDSIKMNLFIKTVEDIGIESKLSKEFIESLEKEN